jgi:hypothetical protein
VLLAGILFARFQVHSRQVTKLNKSILLSIAAELGDAGMAAPVDMQNMAAYL